MTYHQSIPPPRPGSQVGDRTLHFLQCTNLILPNLKVLRWEPRCRYTITDSKMVYLSSLWSLSVLQIVTLELVLEYSSLQEFQSLLENYPALCPNLNSIKFEFRSSERVSRVLFQAFRNHTNWKRVELSCAIDNVLLRHLGLFCKLEVVSLALDLLVANLLDETYFGLADTPFRCTTRLAFTVRGYHRWRDGPLTPSRSSIQHF